VGLRAILAWLVKISRRRRELAVPGQRRSDCSRYDGAFCSSRTL